jgi:hypothetical protein
MGHSKLPHGSDSFVTVEDENLMAIADENYVWTYTSPEFPMLQVSCWGLFLFTTLLTCPQPSNFILRLLLDALFGLS